MCVSLSIVEVIDQWVENTRVMATNSLHSSDQQSLITFGYLLTMTGTISYTTCLISNIILELSSACKK